MQTYTKIKYKIRDVEGVVLIGETITDIDDIKSICRRDYLENLQREISLKEVKILSEKGENNVFRNSSLQKD